MDQDDWKQRGQQLANTHNNDLWALSDWYLEGCNRWGRGWCKEFIESRAWQGVRYDTLRVYGTVARKFPPELRYHNVAFTLYQAARSLPVDHAQSLLRHAERENWGTNKLRIEARRLRFQGRFDGGTIVSDISDLIRRKKWYRVIAADPPWAWETAEGTLGPYYPRMTLQELCALRVPEISGDSAFLFLWAQAAGLEDGALPLMRAWGYEYVTHAVWDKIVRPGPGSYFRMMHELLLVGRRPHAPRHFIDQSLPSIIRAKRTQPHSSKPAIVFDIIERAVNGPRLELFGRHRRDGWDVLGNELPPADNILRLTDSTTNIILEPPATTS